ncbi:MAG TPA: phenylalanine 4-monooxygenase [Stellaceae bacterium]|jgi:phenylalanine-4-hydroxylase|nr:phenylalanine 4-monooxygenase [Stellaceae bacterium]
MKDVEHIALEQEWDRYTPEQHAIWRTLFHRQEAILARRACQPFLDGLKALGVEADGIPDFRRLNEALGRATGWQITAVPGLVADGVFFEHLANRRFPSTCFIRRQDQLDYLQEPDIFHDIFGHVPMLMNPVFADYMEAYGQGGLKALRLDNLEHLARLYWYTVEFGLIRTEEGVRIYGSGIVSSKGESIYCIEDAKPNRIAFDLLRVMRTRYRIDDYQESYFVIDSFEQLFDATQPDFAPYYAALEKAADIEPGAVVEGDRLL